MDKERRILGMLGLAMKSGNIIIGQKAVKRHISCVGDKFVILAADCGQSVEAVVKKCEMHGVPYVKLNVKKDELGRYIGKKAVSVIALTDKGFIDGIKGIINI